MIKFFARNRTSVRLAFALRMVSMAVGSFLSLVWTRLLLRAMGDSIFGSFLSFQAIARLGGLGDAGLSGAISIMANVMLGKGQNDELRKLLSSARSLCLLVAGLLFAVFVVLSPWLPRWMNFHEVPGVGSLSLLFICGGLGAAALVLAGYFASLNYAYGTVTWPILPAVLIGQVLAPFLHWRLALLGAPLWVQYAPYTFTVALGGVVAWLMLKWSHPWLGELRPLEVNSAAWKKLTTASGWVYLCSLGSVIYIVTDRLVINAWIGPEILPRYQANFKVCELAAGLVLTAGFVGFPKIIHWISSPEALDRTRALTEINRLNAFQSVFGCGIALGYLALNDLFVRLWLGAAYNGPLGWQVAFACGVAIMTSGDVGIQLTSRHGDKAIRWAGLMWGGTGALNLLLSILSVRSGSVTGVAIATVIAQSVLSLTANWRASQHLGLPAVSWLWKTWAAPLTIVLAAAALKAWLPGQSLSHIGSLFGLYTILFLLACGLAGMRKEMLSSELATLRSALKV